MQVEEDKFKLFYVMLQVPQTIVKHLNRVAQTGYDKLRLQVAGDTEAGEQETEEEALEYANEVTARARVCEGRGGDVSRHGGTMWTIGLGLSTS